ncbi:MAG: T9SS type A sorting domain-containing protein [Chlorobi bacterium]|nr:T9SS type A sorting domain-containing protein [Chlorobiota bacterium]
MRLIYTVIFIVLFAAVSFAQSLDGIKVCIDPGHGGHDPANDRHVVEADFWESEGNYYKALHAEDILTSLGATVILTRHGNSDSDEIALSVRAGIANANNVDLFHSIHSNATGTSNRTNFSLVLFRGYTDNPVFPQAKDYAIKVYRNLEKVNHVLDKSWDVVYGDWTFYPSWGTSGLGVLRPLTMPGVLSEGSFHDYIPEAWRLKNSEYLRHEAWAITRSMLEYFGRGTLPNGIVAGILRDPLENVPASYQPIAELGDTKKPLNNVHVVLEPGGLVYDGDDQNNGYFFFENIAPGNYKVYLEAEDYSLDSASVTVTANKSVFVYRNLSLIPNENNPNVVSSIPANGVEQVSNAGNIEIAFDIRMDASSTESAFSISPSVDGTFSWKDNQKTLVFNPTQNLTPGEKYTVSISNAAQTIFGKNLVFGYSLQFTTRSKLNLVRAYPDNGETDISKTVQVRLQFDQAIDATTLPGNIQFLDLKGNPVNLIVDFNLYNKGIIAFVPNGSLDKGGTYQVKLGDEIGDIEGVKYQENTTISFTVEDYDITAGNLVDDFEINNYWGSPLDNPNSVGVDASSAFTITEAQKVNGNSSAELKYGFTQADGYYKVSKSVPSDIGGSNDTEFGIWVKGDLSGNVLEYWFADAQSSLHSIVVDTLNFTGWKMKSVKLSDVGGDNLTFEGVGIRRISSADSSGVIYIDDAQYNFVTPVEKVKSNLPEEYSLEQNYPNPFNPSTKIKFNIPKDSNVKLEIFNIIGERVVTIISNKEYKPGSYTVTWDGTNQFGRQVPSGVYLYKLSAGQFSSVKKMMMLK